MPINKITLANTNLTVYVIGLGCLGFSVPPPGQPSREQSLQVISEALKQGVNLFDTAAWYGADGHNELLLGEAIRIHGRDKFIIASKFGVERTATGIAIDGSPENARKSLERALQRLGTDYVDIYSLARVDPNVPIEETVKGLKQLKEEGKIKYIGLSEVSAATLRRAHSVCPISVIESEFSLWSLHLRDDVIPTMRELGISLLAYSPLGRGFLTGEYKKPEDLPATDLRRQIPRFNEYFEHNLQLVVSVEKLAKKKGVTNSQLALAWILSQSKNDIIPIPGTTKVTRLHENLAAAEIQFTKEELDEIEEVISKFDVKGTRYPPAQVYLLQQ